MTMPRSSPAAPDCASSCLREQAYTTCFILNSNPLVVTVASSPTLIERSSARTDGAVGEPIAFGIAHLNREMRKPRLEEFEVS